MFGFELIILSPDTLESHSRALKTRITALFPTKACAKKLAHWIGAQGQIKLAKKLREHALILTSPPENPKPKTKIFFQSQLEDLLNPQMLRTVL